MLIKYFLSLFFSLILLTNTSFASLWVSGDQGTVLVPFSGTSIVYLPTFEASPMAYAIFHVTSYTPVPSSCSPSVEILGGAQVKVMNYGTTYWAWNFYLDTNGYANYVNIAAGVPQTLGNTGTYRIFAGANLGAGWNYVSTRGIIAFHGATCSAGNMEVTGVLNYLYYSGGQYYQANVPITMSNGKF